ncbi:hypothetical protein SNEBB_006645 [Seison nebaliae]|nr:hypothetical protein SNEBB_006645 [Seison nebaliae]
MQRKLVNGELSFRFKIESEPNLLITHTADDVSNLDYQNKWVSDLDDFFKITIFTLLPIFAIIPTNPKCKLPDTTPTIDVIIQVQRAKIYPIDRTLRRIEKNMRTVDLYLTTLTDDCAEDLEDRYCAKRISSYYNKQNCKQIVMRLDNNSIDTTRLKSEFFRKIQLCPLMKTDMRKPKFHKRTLRRPVKARLFNYLLKFLHMLFKKPVVNFDEQTVLGVEFRKRIRTVLIGELPDFLGSQINRLKHGNIKKCKVRSLKMTCIDADDLRNMAGEWAVFLKERTDDVFRICSKGKIIPTKKMSLDKQYNWVEISVNNLNKQYLGNEIIIKRVDIHYFEPRLMHQWVDSHVEVAELSYRNILEIDVYLENFFKEEMDIALKFQCRNFPFRKEQFTTLSHQGTKKFILIISHPHMKKDRKLKKLKEIICQITVMEHHRRNMISFRNIRLPVELLTLTSAIPKLCTCQYFCSCICAVDKLTFFTGSFRLKPTATDDEHSLRQRLNDAKKKSLELIADDRKNHICNITAVHIMDATELISSGMKKYIKESIRGLEVEHSSHPLLNDLTQLVVDSNYTGIIKRSIMKNNKYFITVLNMIYIVPMILFAFGMQKAVCGFFWPSILHLGIRRDKKKRITTSDLYINNILFFLNLPTLWARLREYGQTRHIID